MSESSRPWHSSSILWILLLYIITLTTSTLALPTITSSRGLLHRNADNGTNSGLGNDVDGSSNNNTTSTTIMSSSSSSASSSAGSNSMSALSDEPVTVQLGAGFIIGCVLGVVGYAVVKLVMKTVRGGVEVSAERRGRSRRQRRGSAATARSEDRPDLFTI